MIKRLKRLAAGEQGQDVVEYTLLVAFVAVVSAALFLLSASDIGGIWGHTENQLSVASKTAG